MTENVLYSIIYILLYKNIYNIYYKYIYNTNINSKELKSLISSIKDLHEVYPEKESFSVDEFEVFFKTQSLGLSEKQYLVYSEIFKSLREIKVAPEMAKTLLEAFKRQQVLQTLSLAAFEAQEGSKTVADLSALLAELENPLELEEEPKSPFVSSKLTELYAAQIKKRGLRWRLNFLNQALGSLRKGDFGFVFARPETGKTTFLASEATFMAEQLKPEDGPILWFNNEEQGAKVGIRCIQSSLGLTTAELGQNLEKYEKDFYNLTNDKIKIVDAPGLGKRDVERFCNDYSPSLIIFDQIDKIQEFDNDREDLRLGSIYIWARELAKKHCPVIGVCQADGTGDGQKWLTMNNVSNAKTSKQAEADWILGIGTVYDRALADIRYLNISKNKLTGDEDSLPRLRHGQTEVLIRADIGRYEDLVN